MSNRNPEFFREYLKVLGGQISYLATAKAMNISEDWVYRVLRASKAASKVAAPSLEERVFFFEIEEGDNEPQWFHQHVKNCVRYSIEAIEAAARARALHGTFTVAQYKGQTVYKIDPALISFTDDDLALWGGDRYLRDKKGNLVPELVWTPPSTDLVLGVLAAQARKLYGKNLAVSMDAKFSGGVTFSGGPKANIAAPLPVLQIVDSAEPERAAVDEQPPADFSELEEDLAVSDTDPNAALPGPNGPGLAPVDEPEPVSSAIQDTGPMIRDAQPSGPNPLIKPRAGRPLSDLERDLLAGGPKGKAAIQRGIS